VAVATAMAVSGTVILLALRLQKSFPPPQFALHQIPPSSPPVLRSCISNGGSPPPLCFSTLTHSQTHAQEPVFCFCTAIFCWHSCCGVVLVQLGRRARRRRWNACTSRRTWLSPAETDKSSGTEYRDRRRFWRVPTRIWRMEKCPRTGLLCIMEFSGIVWPSDWPTLVDFGFSVTQKTEYSVIMLLSFLFYNN